ncbi:hypothetical protein ACGFYZ_33795 [Streptomyces sp. NPDC048330]|uniref:hypothetical protein n=1 Tax=Streptomyces sp. NPDC048330 TaxID=3365533 RepID=UPI0037205BF5
MSALPPRSFVAALALFLSQRGRPLEADALGRLQDLCRRAHEASGSPAVRLAFLQAELAQVRAEKTAGEAELATLQKHADRLTAELRQALEEARSTEQRHLSRIRKQGHSLRHAQSYTRALESELTDLQAQVGLIQSELEVLRRQNTLLLAEGSNSTADPDGPPVKAAVPTTSTQARAVERPPQTVWGVGRLLERIRPPRTPKTSKAPAAPQPVAPKPTPTFVVSWTGNEDPRKFTKNPFAVVAPLLLGGMAAIFLFVAEGSPVIKFSVAGLCMLCAILLAEDMIPARNTSKLIQARTLRLNGTGLTAKDDSGRQHLPWACIKYVSVHYAASAINERQPLTLHMQLKREAPEAGYTYRTAGWPLELPPPAACRQPPADRPDEWVPICMLGLLTGPQKTDLHNTLATYLETPPEGIWST